MTNREIILLQEKHIKTANFIIKRQNEEIERLTKECDSLKCIINEKRYEINRLKYRVDTIPKLIVTTRKEFAEKLKKKFNKIPQQHFSLLGVECAIDSLVKEMEADEQ